jgi:D-alanine-D-alanine ligase
MIKTIKPPVDKILLVYNIDMTWPLADREYAEQLVTEMVAGFCRYGYHAEAVAIRHNLKALDAYDPREWLVFNWCEGFEGLPWSDAMVAEELEARKFFFTGASSQVLEILQNKWRVKNILREAGIPTPEGALVNIEDCNGWSSFPAIVKPVAQHGSFGITRRSVVKNTNELKRQVRWIRKKFGEDAVVEHFIDGREFQVTVWGNIRLQVLPAVELDFSAFQNSLNRLYTFEAKFNPNSAAWDAIKWIYPSPDDPALRAEIETIAKTSFRALDCRDYARIDMRLFDGKPLVLDVNPNPDLDPTSMMPMAAEAAGLDYTAMTLKIIEFAASRMRRQRLRRARRSSQVAAIA